MQNIERVAALFSGENKPASARAVRSGYRSETYLVDLSDGSSLLLQKLAAPTVPQPVKAMHNILEAEKHLKAAKPDRAPAFLTTANGKALVREGDNYWRAVPFTSVTRAAQPAAADQIEMFGRMLGAFHASLADFPADKLYFSKENEHNTPLHYIAFEKALLGADEAAAAAVASEAEFIQKRQSSCAALLELNVPARAVHNDACIENALFSADGEKAVGFSDLDTLMPGMFAFDFGEAVCSTISACPADDKNLSNVRINAGRFEAFVRGYMSEAKGIFVRDELKSLVMGARMMAYEKGIRLLTDHLTGNRNFPIGYPDHNLHRARVQLLLCSQIESNYNAMCQILMKYAR